MKIRLLALSSLLMLAVFVSGWTWDDRLLAASWVSFGW